MTGPLPLSPPPLNGLAIKRRNFICGFPYSMTFFYQPLNLLLPKKEYPMLNVMLYVEKKSFFLRFGLYNSAAPFLTHF